MLPILKKKINVLYREKNQYKMKKKCVYINTCTEIQQKLTEGYTEEY